MGGEVKALTNVQEDVWRTGPVSHEEALEILQLFCGSHFQDGRPKARITIPADPSRDSDIRMGSYIAQCEQREKDLTTAKERAEAELRRLNDDDDDEPACTYREMRELYHSALGGAYEAHERLKKVAAERDALRARCEIMEAVVAAARNMLHDNGMERNQNNVKAVSVDIARRAYREALQALDNNQQDGDFFRDFNRHWYEAKRAVDRAMKALAPTPGQQESKP